MVRLLSIISLVLALVLFPPAALALVSNNAVPGDATYPIKRILEDGIFAVASLNPTTKAWFAAARSDRRFKEFTTLVAQGKKSGETLNELVEQTQVAASQIAQVKDEGQKEKLIQQLSDSIKKYDQGLQQASSPVPANPAPAVQATPIPQATTVPVPQPKQTSLPVVQPTTKSAPTPQPTLAPTAVPIPIPTPHPTSTPVPPPPSQNDDRQKQIDDARKQLDEIRKRLEEAQRKQREHNFRQESNDKKEDKQEKKEERGGSDGRGKNSSKK